MIKMKMLRLILILGPVLMIPVENRADEIAFPQNKADIVDALSFEDKRVVSAGDGYEIDAGRVYKVIGGKKYRLRGLQIVSAAGVLPKSGALINFAWNSFEIDPASKPLLDAYGQALQENLKDAVVVIAGHTDATGAIAYNDALSLKRARSVRQYLIGNYAIAPDRLLCQGYGEKRPIKPNTDESGRAMNRRVEFIRIK
jgi:hypothetical protein